MNFSKKMWTTFQKPAYNVKKSGEKRHKYEKKTEGSLYCRTDYSEYRSLYGIKFTGDTENGYFMLHHGAMYEPMILENQEYYRFFTCMFLHFGIQHLLNNMVMLGALGWQLEPVIGKVKYLLIYFISGLGGSGLSFAWNVMHEEQSVSAGASGAIFGLMGALLYVVIANRGRLGDLSGKGMMLMVLLGLYCGMTSTGVDNLAHIGGLVCGFILALILYRKKKKPAYTAEWIRQSAGDDL